MVLLLSGASFSLLLIALSLSDSISLSSQRLYDYYGGSSSSAADTSIANGVPLRIMTLGASVCRGDVSNGTLGFRKPLRDKLVANGNMVNMVGSVRVGEFLDNDVEAHGGNRVDQVHDWASYSVPLTKPNLFLINVGSNDCLQKWDTPNYHVRLNDFVSFLLEQSPNGTVVLSTLLTNTVPGTEPCIFDINEQIRALYARMREQGMRVVMAEMHDQFVPEGDTLERPHPGNITPDGTHPDDAGYAMMAKIFYQTILEADRNGFITRAEDNGVAVDGEAGRDAIREEERLPGQVEGLTETA
ncbi:SGNH hydrolase-type esterase domain-containing protein [Pestalotiopsis sp. NC0098]|nr:SGNH hydrolase-type esterase domain-containing protein [Pestalotiopsis sp. NC0098]